MNDAMIRQDGFLILQSHPTEGLRLDRNLYETEETAKAAAARMQFSGLVVLVLPVCRYTNAEMARSAIGKPISESPLSFKVDRRIP